MFCYYILYYITLLYIISYNSEPKKKLIYIYGCNLSLIVRLKFMNPMGQFALKFDWGTREPIGISLAWF